MAEAIGLASGLLAIATFAFQTTSSLYEAIQSLKSQRKTVLDLKEDIGSLKAVLSSLSEQLKGDEANNRFEPIRTPLYNCATTCQELGKMLAACTSHSDNGKDSVRDWLKMRYREKTLADFQKRLGAYKSTLIVALNSMNLHDHSITKDALDSLKRLIEGTKEDLEDQLVDVHEAITTGDASQKEALDEDKASLQRSLNTLKWAQQLAEITQPKIVIERNEAGQGARLLAGTDTSNPQFSLSVAENRAGLGAIMAAGVHTPETLRALMANSQASNLALALEALQTQSSSTNIAALQSLLRNLSAESTEAQK